MALTLSNTVAGFGSVFRAIVQGRAAGGSLALTTNPGGRWSLAGTELLCSEVQSGDTPIVSETVAEVTTPYSFTIQLAGASPVITSTPPVAVVGEYYDYQPTVTGGGPFYRWSLANGSLPAGTTLNAASGRVTGRVTAPAVFQLSVTSNGTGRTGGFPSVPPASPALPPVVLVGGTGWTAASGVSVGNGAAFAKAHPSGRSTGLVLTKNPTTGTFGGARATVAAPFKMTDYPILAMDINPQLISGSVTLRVSSDNFASKRMEFSWPFPSEIYGAEWNRVSARTNADGTIDPNGGTWAVTGGMTTDELINAVQVSINSAANDAARVDVDRIMAFTSAPVRGVVMFGFDRFEDASLVDRALPIARKYGISCYAAGDTDKVAPMGAAWSRVKQLYDAGWPIPLQGPDHKNYTVVGAAQLTTDVATSRATLTAVGLANALEYFAYPWSANNAATDAALLAAGFKMASTGIAWNGHPNEVNLGFKLIGQGRVNIGSLTLTQVKRLIDRARFYGVVVDLFCHGLVAGGDGTAPPADALVWYENDWDAAIAYAVGYRDLGWLDVLTPVSLFNSRGSLPVAA